MIDVAFAAAERLAAQAANRFAMVGNLADFAALSDLPLHTPAAYVIPLEERANQGEVIGASLQQHELLFGVVLLVRHAGDAGGSRATMALQPLRDAVHNALVGWTPDGCHGPVIFTGGRLAEMFDGGALAWQDNFNTARSVQRALAS